MDQIFTYNTVHDISVWLQTSSKLVDIIRFGSHSGKMLLM